MRTATLMVGTRASGKSSFSKKAVELDPSLILVSRDSVLVDLCGKTHFDSYSGPPGHVFDHMWMMVTYGLTSSPNARLIFDAWNGSSMERRYLVKKLRQLGAERVVAWYLTTPVEYVSQWFWLKPGIAKMDDMRDHQGEGLTFYGEDAPIRDHKLYHELAADIDGDGFDEVIRVNPVTTGPEHLLKLQTSLTL